MKASYPVLLAEDNPISRKMLEKILVKEGFEVTSVENGKEALALFREQFFPIVLTDWLMPEMEGPELCKAIRYENKFILLALRKLYQLFSGGINVHKQVRRIWYVNVFELFLNLDVDFIFHLFYLGIRQGFLSFEGGNHIHGNMPFFGIFLGKS